VAAQLTDTAGGTLVWSQTFQVSRHDLFQLQDDIVQRIVESLALPLSTRERRLMRRDVPASATAYEYFLRANQLATDSRHWITARDLYQQCVELDPSYAPAWCRLGRCYRLLAKYALEGNSRENLALAQQALDKALALNPELPMAHGLATALDVERGRAREAMVRLLELVGRQPSEPELYAALVHSCRYCGLLDASVAAYEAARRLDPAVRTSVAHTYLARGEYENAAAADLDSFPYVSLMALKLLGREDEIRARLDRLRSVVAGETHLEQLMRSVSLAYFGGDAQSEVVRSVRHFSHEGFTDPEGWLYWSTILVDVIELDEALELVSRAVNGGYACDAILRESPLFARLRGHAAFGALIERAMTLRMQAEEAFREHGGLRALGQEALAV
jgi:tetratricopeptide (TPR) repeat protein